jgi:hypothetical protein
MKNGTITLENHLAVLENPNGFNTESLKLLGIYSLKLKNYSLNQAC